MLILGGDEHHDDDDECDKEYNCGQSAESRIAEQARQGEVTRRTHEEENTSADLCGVEVASDQLLGVDAAIALLWQERPREAVDRHDPFSLSVKLFYQQYFSTVFFCQRPQSMKFASSFTGMSCSRHSPAFGAIAILFYHYF